MASVVAADTCRHFAATTEAMLEASSLQAITAQLLAVEFGPPGDGPPSPPPPEGPPGWCEGGAPPAPRRPPCHLGRA
eukprot:11219970-Lingulodinium_polyedra.AAC.1